MSPGPSQYQTSATIGGGRRPGRPAALLVVLAGVAVVAVGVAGGHLTGPPPGPAVGADRAASAPASAASRAPSPTLPPRIGAPPPSPALVAGALRRVRDAGGLVVADPAGERLVDAGQLVAVVQPITSYGVPAYELELPPDQPVGAGDGPASVAVATEEALLADTEPAAPACPTPPLGVAALAGLLPFERTACFGDRAELTVGPAFVRSYERGDFLTVDGRVADGSALRYAPGPAAAGTVPGWVVAHGRFDGPAACAAADLGVELACRERFRVIRFEPVAPPSPFVPGRWLPLDPSPLPRGTDQAFAWTGSTLLVWGRLPDDSDPTQPRIAPGPLGAAYEVERGWRVLPDAGLGRPEGAVVQWVDGRLVVVGGSTPGDELTGRRAGAAYDPATNRWTPIAPSPVRIPASSPSAVVGRRLVVAVPPGAVGSSGTVALLTFEPRANRWTRLPALRPGSGEPQQLLAAGDALVALDPVDVGPGSPPVPGYVLAPGGDAWQPLADPSGLTLDRAVAVAGGALVGTGTSPDLLPLLVRLDVGTGSWSRAPADPVLSPDAPGRPLAAGQNAVLAGELPVLVDGRTLAVRPLTPAPGPGALWEPVAWTGDRLIVLQSALTPDGSPDEANAVRAPWIFVPDDPARLAGS